MPKIMRNAAHGQQQLKLLNCQMPLSWTCNNFEMREKGRNREEEDGSKQKTQMPLS